MKTIMSWNILTDRQKELDQSIEQCGIRLDLSRDCFIRVMSAIGANKSEAGFVKKRIELRLKTQELITKVDNFINNTETILDQFEKEEEEWNRKGRKYGLKF